NLNITEPSLSHAISQLEEEVVVMLFEKNGRNTQLTAFGREFLAGAERALGTLDAGVESIQNEAAGDGGIRLGLIRPLGMEFVPRLA
ncbi:LysR family transcriptional regulator, partial [Coprococcus eutactus]|uniref:LysR family transcriptional regulator n=1 Tax=Coprococcus eutactus TaxID=33043 RepID=UPI00210C9237